MRDEGRSKARNSWVSSRIPESQSRSNLEGARRGRKRAGARQASQRGECDQALNRTRRHAGTTAERREGRGEVEVTSLQAFKRSGPTPRQSYRCLLAAAPRHARVLTG